VRRPCGVGASDGAHWWGTGGAAGGAVQGTPTPIDTGPGTAAEACSAITPAAAALRATSRQTPPAVAAAQKPAASRPAGPAAPASREGQWMGAAGASLRVPLLRCNSCGATHALAEIDTDHAARTQNGTAGLRAHTSSPPADVMAAATFSAAPAGALGSASREAGRVPVSHKRACPVARQWTDPAACLTAWGRRACAGRAAAVSSAGRSPRA